MEGKKYKYLSSLVVVFYLVGIAGHLIGTSRVLFLQLTPFILVLTSILVVGDFILSQKPKLRTKIALWLAVVVLTTFVLEAFGTNTGSLFGQYNYGPTLGVKYLDTPLIIGANWIIIILGSYSFLKYLAVTKNLAFLSAVTAVCVDVFLEITAVKLDYWSWSNNQVPAQNYIVWFLIVFIAVYFLEKLNPKTAKLLVPIFIMQSLFIVSLALLL